MIDRFSRWPEAIPLTEISAEIVSTAFYTHWVARFGSPISITTDQGPQFEAALFKALTNLIGCQRIRTSAYHPASNGILERWHRTLKAAIMCHETTNWIESLPSVLLGLRSCFKEDLKASSAEHLYGSTLRIPGEFFIEEDFPIDPEIFLEKHRIHMRNIRSTPTSHHSKRSPFVYKNLFDCTHVWIREDAVKRSLQPPYSGPFPIEKRISDHLFSVNVSGRIVNISTERLKPAFIPRTSDSTELTSSSSVPVPASSVPVPASPVPVPASPVPVPASSVPVPASSVPIPASPVPVPTSSDPSSSTVGKPLRTYPLKKKKVHFATNIVTWGGVL